MHGAGKVKLQNYKTAWKHQKITHFETNIFRCIIASSIYTRVKETCRNFANVSKFYLRYKSTITQSLNLTIAIK